jgi:hypothetical protein
MRYKLLLALLFTVVTIDARAVSPSGRFQQRLLQLQRQGSCADLPRFGISTHRGRNPDDVNIRLISEVGALMVRLDIPWIELERQGRYDFRPYDDLINKLRQSGKSIVLVLAYGHPDHSDGRADNGFPLPPRTPEQRAAYGRYAQAVAGRYHGPDIVYEIWNEPNLNLFWPPAFDANVYGELLAEGAHAIRQVEPTATIISAGLANENNPALFLHALATAGALDGVDGVTFHPYRQDGPENSLYDIAEFESAAAERAGRPLWITEWGYSEAWLAKRTKDTRRAQAVMIARVMLTAALAKAKAAFVYDLIDDRRDPNDQESSFGLYDYDFKPKESATAFRALAGLMSGCKRYEFKVDTSQNTITAAFYFGGTASYVIWAYAADRPRDVCFTAPGVHPTELKDISGNRLSLQACSAASQVRLNLSEASGPVILQAEGASSK